jgi:hypothetical protein
VVHGVANHVDQRIGDLVHDGAVQLGLLAGGEEVHLLAGLELLQGLHPAAGLFRPLEFQARHSHGAHDDLAHRRRVVHNHQ